MTLGLKNIWLVLNKYLSVINAALYALGTQQITDLRKAGEKKIPLVFNILLFLFLLLLLFAMTYGAYRREMQ